MPTINMQATGNNIRNMMKKNGITVADMQTRMGFNTPQAIYKWIRGVNMPTIDNMLMMSVIFGVKIDDIIVADNIANNVADNVA